MLIDETLSNLRAAIAALRAKDPRLDAHLSGNTPEISIAPGEKAWAPPVVGSPQWFLDEIREHFGQDRTDYEVDELCGLKVIQREELSEPVLVFSDGSWYTIVPEWARRTAEQIQKEDFERRVRSAEVGAGVVAAAPAG